jgi:hypothetical protein
MRSKSKRPQRSIYLLCLFVVGLIISCSAMQVAYNAGNRQLVVIFALASGITCIGSCLSFWGFMVGFAAQRHQARVPASMHSDRDGQDYRARFFLKDRISLLCLTVGSALLTGFSFSRPGHYPMKALFVGMLVFSSITAYRHCLMSVLFTKRAIEAKVGLFTHYSKPYDQVVALTVAPRSLKLRFADGRKLNILPGLGDMAKIATLLEERINITPEFIGWNGSKNPPTSTHSQN